MSGIFHFLIIGLICMLILGLVRRKIYGFSIIEAVIYSVVLLVSGVIGTLVLFFVENGRWGGTSFFGSLFFIPLVFWVISLLTKKKYAHTMAYLAVPVCAMLAVMKVRCLNDGCCSGRIITLNNGESVIFPSQIIEAAIVIILLIILMILEKRSAYLDIIYPFFLVLYGGTRLILNCFRKDLTPFVLNLSPGHFWSIVSIIVGGILCLYLLRKHSKCKNV